MPQGAYEEAVAACDACAAACDACLSACLLEPEVTPLARCIALDLECAALCRLLSGFSIRGSKFAPKLAEACKTLCDACAEECGRHEHGHCRRCAEACRACSVACDRLLSLGVEAPG